MSSEVLIKCGHCQNLANCKVRASYEYEDDDEYDSRYIYTFKWHILQCPACSRPLFLETVKTSAIFADEEPFLKEKVLFPLERNLGYLGAVPDDVRRSYEAALKVQNIEPNAFAVLVGRTLEIICRQEKASGKRLMDKLDFLANSGRIPQVLAQMSQNLRLLRNLGAHIDEDGDEVDKKDIPFIIEFVDAILEYLYIAPIKISRIEKRIKRKQSGDWIINPNVSSDCGFLDEDSDSL